jgi:hypothetical protein
VESSRIGKNVRATGLCTGASPGGFLFFFLSLCVLFYFLVWHFSGGFHYIAKAIVILGSSILSSRIIYSYSITAARVYCTYVAISIEYSQFNLPYLLS